MHLAILGRQPEISLAELESLYGSTSVERVSEQAAKISAASINLKMLGGSQKIGTLLKAIPSANFEAAQPEIMNQLVLHASKQEGGKVVLGLSIYGQELQPKKLQKLLLRAKKQLRADGRSVRIVPNKTPALNTAQVLHNKLTHGRNLELLVIHTREGIVLARTEQVQDIEAYAKRDQKRPMRDAKVGMLPPKLAQTMLNLALGQGGREQMADGRRQDGAGSTSSSLTPRPSQLSPRTILDCFCGTGVVLQEAMLMGHQVIGSDLEPRMVEYTEKNLEWLSQSHDVPGKLTALTVGDAKSHKWADSSTIDAVTAEAYLGPPLSVLPSQQELDQIIKNVDLLLHKTLTNLASQLKAGISLCLAVPAWRTKSGFRHLKLIDDLEKLGYTRRSFEHATPEDLIYHRPGQVVARELLVLKRM